MRRPLAIVSAARATSALLAMLLAALLPTNSSRAESKPDFSREAVESIRIDAKRIASFAKSDPARRTFGKLEFRGGLVLSSPSSKFGGWSALEIDPDGRRLLAVSDAGVWLTGTLTYDGDAPSGVRDAHVGPLTGTGGAALTKNRDRDAEGMVLLDGSLSKGTVLIAFEQNHRIGRFPINDKGIGAPTGYLTLPPEARRQPSNKSLESVCMLRGGPNRGAVITLSERFPDRTGTRHTGWMLPAGAPATANAWSALSLRNIDGYDLTDCRGLPDGSLLVLERRFRWSSWYEGVKTRLRRFSAAEIRPGAMMEGEVLLEADMDFEIDNLEGLGVHRSATGETILTMISDNNFNSFLQRTVLLQFALTLP
ncbi:MAG: esterase-like activity of phytase family protein, partial [Hyphomicrobiaceae bacterium]